jgi:hypothetical protein
MSCGVSVTSVHLFEEPCSARNNSDRIVPTQTYTPAMSSVNNKSESKLSDMDIASAAALNMYKNGSDARQQKNGSPNVLVSKVMNADTIKTIGVYKWYLSEEDRKMVGDKSKCSEPAFVSKMCQAVLMAYNAMHEPTATKDVKVYVRVPGTQQMQMLQAAAQGQWDRFKWNNLIKCVRPSHMFLNQERQKVSGK